MARVGGFADVLLAPEIGGVLFLVYAVALAGIGTATLARRDVLIA
jgi:hypothetical protein